MSATDFIAILPLLIVAGASLCVMAAIAIRRSHFVCFLLTLVGLGASFASLWIAQAETPRLVTPLLIIDRFAIFYIGLITAASFAVALLSYGYLDKCEEAQREELYVLLLLATLGSDVLVASTHFASFFLGLEILSVSLYGLTAYLPARRISVEAGIKYLVLAASSAAFLLFGMALIYADAGTMSLAQLAGRPATPGNLSAPMWLAGAVLIVTGIGFKLGVVPFHLWTPDVYEGAPAPITAFIATVSKGSMFALLVRFFEATGWRQTHELYVVFAIMAIASMIAGNLLALLQSNVKRILAYSSIAHLGYLLVPFLAGGELAVPAITFYLVAYFVTTVGAFGVVAVLSDGVREADRLEDYRGLFWRRPVLGAIFTMNILSLAGIPMTAGFLGKFYIVAAGASESIWALIIILVVSSVIGVFYYLRIVVALFSDVPQATETVQPPSFSLPLIGYSTLGLLMILLIWFGVYPQPLLRLIIFPQ